jgi:hypothetical protein
MKLPLGVPDTIHKSFTITADSLVNGFIYVAEFRAETSCHINKTIYKSVGCNCVYF